MATKARSERQASEAARRTNFALRELTVSDIDPGHGPRDLLRWAMTEAIRRAPEPLTRFEDPWQYDARVLAERVHLELPAALVVKSSEVV